MKQNTMPTTTKDAGCASLEKCAAVYMLRKICAGMLCAALLTILSGCSIFKPHTVVKPEIVEVPRYIREPLPADLVKTCEYAEPDPACWRNDHREFCDEQLLEVRLGYRAKARCDNADKAALRALGPVKP